MISLLFLALAAQSAPAAPTPGIGGGTALRDALQDCSAHKFETVVTAMVDGKPKRSKLKLCGTTGQSEEAWIGTLKDSAKKLLLNAEMPLPQRSAMIAALEGEIARLQSGAPASTATAPIIAPPATAMTLKPRDLSKPSGMAAYNALPQLPAPTPVAKVTLEQAKSLPPIDRPQLRFDCFEPGAVGEQPCADVSRHTLLIIGARGEVKPGVTLRFLRDGEQRAEVPLSAMRKGQTRRIAIPAEVCRGVNSAKMSVETMVKSAAPNAPAQRASTEGPFFLRCA